MKRSSCIVGLTALAVLAGCATQPMGPMVGVLPGQNKSPQAFQDDDMTCRGYAQQMVAGQAQAANNQAVGAGVLGTVLGAGLGAAIGGGQGAAIGAASGAVGGTAIGASQSSAAQGGIQHQYDNAYMQCMYSRGNQVPGAGGYGAPQPPAPGYGPPQGYGPQGPGYGPPQQGYGPPPPGY
jgi:uncharacterized protein YcfJ